MKTLVNNQAELNQLTKRRGTLFAVISAGKKKGKDVSHLEKELNDIRIKIKAIREGSVQETPKVHKVATKKTTQVVPAMDKKYSRYELKKCQNTIDKVLDENDWTNGYEFRSGVSMSIPTIKTAIESGRVVVKFRVEYKTKMHRVYKDMIWYFTPENVDTLQANIDKAETWVMLNSGDMDDKNIVFGQRFNMVQFEKQGFESRGWVKYR